MTMTIRYAVPDDVPALSAVEAECFPPAEAATAAEFAERVAYYGNHFWLMYDGDKLISFVDGFVTDDADLTDEMYENAAMHNENGAWQMIYSRLHAGRAYRSTGDFGHPGCIIGSGSNRIY